jgi:hypothetical protein
MTPRKDRWLSLLEVANLLARAIPRLSEMTVKRRREYILRLVRRVERRDDERISKRVGREVFVSRNAVDALQKWEPEALSELQRSVAHLHEKSKEHTRRINDHGSKLRELAEKQRLADQYIAGMARIERRTTAA